MLEEMSKKELMEYVKNNSVPNVNKRMNKSEIIDSINLHQIAQKREEIQNDLLDQLERSGVIGEYYVDLISDYMSLWDVKNALIADIETKGVSLRYQNGENQWGYKKNDSVGELQRTNNQMLNILRHLDLNSSRAESDTYSDDYLEM